ncbi:MAG TPA: hypothetical protein VK978_03835 [Candidatus Saccharimonadales bacterium]|nr:hypothetical protein [Candidatus Saccharimonadales bacterium]
MSELCQKYCPVRRECNLRLQTVIDYRTNLQKLADALTEAAAQAGRDTAGSSVMPEELLHDLAKNKQQYSDIQECHQDLANALENCSDPIPSERGRSILPSLPAHMDVNEQALLHQIYYDASCGSQLGRVVLARLPRV